MNTKQAKQIKSQAQRIETLIGQLENDASVLKDNGVEVSKNTDIDEQQQQLQDELEQVTSDLLALLDTSGTIEPNGDSIDLANTGRRPVSSGSLPQPSVERPEGRGQPTWANSGNGN